MYCNRPILHSLAVGGSGKLNYHSLIMAEHPSFNLDMAGACPLLYISSLDDFMKLRNMYIYIIDNHGFIVIGVSFRFQSTRRLVLDHTEST